MKVFFMVTQIVFSAFSEDVLALSGSGTPEALKLAYSEFTYINLSLPKPNTNPDFIPFLILDITFNPNNFALIDSIAESFKVPYLTLTNSNYLGFSSFRHSAVPSLSEEAKALTQIIFEFQWQDFTIFLSNSLQNIQISDMIKKSFKEFKVKTCIYDSQITEEGLDMIVKRYLKVTAVKNLLVLDEGESLELLIKLIKKRKINLYGSYLLFSTSSIYSVDLEGAVILSHEFAKDSKSSEDYQLKLLEYLIGQPQEIDLQGFKKKCLDSVCIKEFSILNQIEGKKIVKGTISDSVKINIPLIFPGNNSKASSISIKTEIPVMIANGTREPNNETDKYLTSMYYKGALYAVEQVNAELEPLNFEYKLIPTDCGNLVIDVEWSIGCLSQFSKYNSVAYLSGFWAQSVLSNYLSLKALGLNIPQVTPDGHSDFLNNKIDYPNLVKLSGKFDIVVKNTFFIYNVYGWKDISVIVDRDEINILIFKMASSIMKEMGVTVTTPEKYMYLPINYSRNDFEENKHVFNFIKKSGNRVLVMFAKDIGPILEGLYDIGLRKGDIMLSGSMTIYKSITDNNIEKKYLKKRMEIAFGSLIAGNVEFIGDLGKKVGNELKKKNKSIINMCPTYNAFLTISNSIKYLIDKGENYDNPEALMEVIRNIRFNGCSGDVFFIPSENSRNYDWIGVYQIVVNSTTDEAELIQISALNKFDVNAVKLLNEPVWGTGEKTVPSNYRQKDLCVYNNNKQYSMSGMFTLHSVSIVFMLIILGVAYVTFRIFKQRLPSMNNKIHLTYNDVFQQVFFIFELLQILSLEPDQGLLGKVMKDYHLNLGFDFIKAFNLKFDNYWKFFRILISIIGVHSILTIFCIILKKKLSQKSYIINQFHFLFDSVLPIINHLLFMPAGLMLLSIYRCEEGISNKISESFFYRDCSRYCYKGTHLRFAAISGFIIVIHFAASIFFRHFWEISQEDLSIRTKPSYLSILSIFQFLLILIKVNLEYYSSIIEGCLISTTLIVLIVITMRLKPYNYEKSNVIQITLLAICLMVTSMTTLYLIFPYNTPFTISMFIGVGLIIITGIKMSNRCPRRFLSDYNDAVPTLIKFQFSKSLNKSITQSKYFRKISYRLEAESGSPELFKRVSLK